MLKRIRKNDGMTLVEVLVSMLVLSIAVVTVMTAFSMGTKVNVTSKKTQSVESLMENLLEYAQAGGTDYKTWFNLTDADHTVTQPFSPTEDKQIEELTNVKQGFYDYKVKVTTDRDPDAYNDTSKLNEHKVIQFGATGSNTIVINASETAIASINDDACAYYCDVYMQARQQKIEEEEALAAADPAYIMNPPLPAKSPSDMPSYIDRELWITTATDGSGKMRVIAKMIYEADSSLPFPDYISDKWYEGAYPVDYSDMFDVGSSTDPDANILDQIYILYSKEVAGTWGNGKGIDIRILDNAGAAKTLKSSVFIAMQEPLGKDAAGLSHDAGEKLVFNSYLEAQNKDIYISTKDPKTSADKGPIAMKVYSSANVYYSDGATGVTTESASLVSKDEEFRVVEVTLEIIDPETGAVLDTETVTRLQ